MATEHVRLATSVPGASRLDSEDEGVNATFVGLVDVGGYRERAYIKPLGGKQLINELVATVVGRDVGLQIPPGFLVCVRGGDLDHPDLPDDPSSYYLAYACCEIQAPNLTKRIKASGADAALKLILSNREGCYAATVFDELIANGDRHPGNLLVENDASFWLIDHGHAFTGPNWTPDQLSSDKRIDNQIGDELIKHVSFGECFSIVATANQWQAAYSAIDLDQAWIASGVGRLEGSVLTRSESTSLRGYIAERTKLLAQLVADRFGVGHLEFHNASDQ